MTDPKNTCPGRWITLLLLLALLVLSGCEADQQGMESIATEPPATEETVALPTAPPDGDPKNVTCQGSYTVSDRCASSAADLVVATIGDSQLTNRMLQVYYWLEIAEYLQENPDVTFDQPLDTILCDLDETAVTWQQYFLQRALNTWHTHQALALRAENVSLPTEDAYQPNLSIHSTNIHETMPAVRYLYGYTHRQYQPNDMHQAYLDDLPLLLEELAAANGFGSFDEQLLDLAGPGPNRQTLTDYARLYNLSYMYYTQLTYDMAPTEEELDVYLQENTTEQGTHATIRQILLVPEGAETAPDGTVTAGTDAWEACRAEAEEMLDAWSKSAANARRYARAGNVDEALFGELAVDHSADAGSRDNGGLYSDLRPGQLVEALDDWCFAPERMPGDAAVIQTQCGYHLVYYVSGREAGLVQAEKAILRQKTLELFQATMEEYPMTVNYEAICLGLAKQQGKPITGNDVLYPDIAHERFPIAPLYLQQDYPTTRYGNYPIATHGCGITTLSMLASYMTDEELTPPELCAVYGYYCTNEGSNYIMFDQAPSELGFYQIGRTTKWEDVEAALKSGHVVVSLQHKGYWTRGGHFLHIQEINEDGLLVIRDSNLLNFGKLSGHDIDAHDPKLIPPANALYWIFHEKVVRTPACIRCDDTNHEGVATAMFTQDYYCAKCQTAMQRRDDFIDACGALK